MPASVPSDRMPKTRIPSLLPLVEDELPVTLADAAALWRSIASVELAVVYVRDEAVVGDAAGGTVKVERWRTLPCCREAISMYLRICRRRSGLGAAQANHDFPGPQRICTSYSWEPSAHAACVTTSTTELGISNFTIVFRDRLYPYALKQICVAAEMSLMGGLKELPLFSEAKNQWQARLECTYGTIAQVKSSGTRRIAYGLFRCPHHLPQRNSSRRTVEQSHEKR